MFNVRKKIGIKQIVVIILATLLSLGAVMGGYKLLSNKSKTLSPFIFSVGGLDENGKYVKAKDSLYTKDLIECQGLDISCAFTTTSSYRVFFYDLLEDFMFETALLNEPLSELPDGAEMAKYCRIMLVVDDEDIKFYEVLKYAKQLTVKTYKKQNYKDFNVFKFDEANRGRLYVSSDLSYELGYGISKPVLLKKANETKINTLILISPIKIEDDVKLNQIVFFKDLESNNNYTPHQINYGSFSSYFVKEDSGRFIYKLTFTEFSQVGGSAITDKDIYMVFNVNANYKYPELYVY